MNNQIYALLKYVNKIKNIIHHNLYMTIGFYGVLFIIALCLSAKWIFDTDLAPMFTVSLPPAWQNNGDVNHVLGTDQSGRDIFSYLILGYKATLLMVIKSLICVITIGAIINYLIFFIKPFRLIMVLVFRVIIAIPPLLSVIIITLLLKNNVSYLLLAVGISYMPKFVHTIHDHIMQEWDKTYIVAERLDGLSTGRILNFHIIPNILPIYLTEIVALFSHIILALTILTFLGFGNKINYPDLGMMMRQMIAIIQTNYWAFLAPGFAIIVTILLVNLLNVGINTILTKRVGN